MTTPSPTAEQRAEALADADSRREAIEADLLGELRQLLRAYLPDLRAAVAAQEQAADALLEHVTAQGPEAYPPGARSQTAHGIRYGWKQAPESVEVDDHGRSIAAARELYSPADSAAIIKTVESIRLDAIAGWTDADLAAIHARRVAAEDRPFVRGAAADVERLVKAISASAIKQLRQEAA